MFRGRGRGRGEANEGRGGFVPRGGGGRGAGDFRGRGDRPNFGREGGGGGGGGRDFDRGGGGGGGGFRGHFRGRGFGAEGSGFRGRGHFSGDGGFRGRAGGFRGRAIRGGDGGRGRGYQQPRFVPGGDNNNNSMNEGGMQFHKKRLAGKHQSFQTATLAAAQEKERNQVRREYSEQVQRGGGRGRGGYHQQQERKSSFGFPKREYQQRQEEDENDQDEEYDYDDNNNDQKENEENVQDHENSATSASASASKILSLGQGGAEVKIIGTSSLRYAIVCSILSNKPIIFQLQPSSSSSSSSGGGGGGLPSEAVSFLRLISQVTTGSQFTLSQNGDSLRFVPGLITATGSLVHEYTPPPAPTTSSQKNQSEAQQEEEDAHRGLGYFVEPLLLLLPFSRRAVSLTLVGPSHGTHDLCPHTLRTVTMRIASAFGIEGASVRVVRHSGSAQTGCIILNIQPTRSLKCAKMTDFGFVSRIRGIAFASDVSPDLPQRAATAAKGCLLNFLPDVYVVTDINQSTVSQKKQHQKEQIQDESNNNNIPRRTTSAFGVMLVAETTSKRAVVSQEATAGFREEPERVGERAARLLLDEIASAGCVDRHHQSLALMYMALAPDNVSNIRFGELTSQALSTLDLMAKFLSVRPVIKDVVGDQSSSSSASVSSPTSATTGATNGCMVSCFGSATINLTKRSG